MFCDLLRGLPALYSKRKEWKELSIAEIGIGCDRFDKSLIKSLT
jgi:hypothetical protein